MRHERAIDMVGNTPHLRIHVEEAPRARVYLKLEGANPSGSVKDRAASRMIQKAILDGVLTEGKTILDASSGNMACALAFLARVLGFDCTVAVSSKLTDDKRNFLMFYGAVVHEVGDFTIEGNHWCREKAERSDGDRFFFVDQLHNWENPQAHYLTTGPEILGSFPDVKMVVASLGSGGTLCGTGAYLREHRPDVKVVGVEAEEGTSLPGVGTFSSGDYVTPFIAKARRDGLFDDSIAVSEAFALSRTLQLRDQGASCGIQTGAVLEAGVRAILRHEIEGDVILISGDAGWKNLVRLADLESGRRAG